MLRVCFRLRGTGKGVMFNRRTDALVESLRKGASLRVRKDRTPKDEAQEKLHMHNGQPVIPESMFMTCGKNAGTKVKNGRARITNSEGETSIYSLIQLEEPFLPLLKATEDTAEVAVAQIGSEHDSTDASDEITWEPDVQPGSNDNKECIVHTRPLFRDWEVEGHLHVDDGRIDLDIVLQLLEVMGSDCGFGSGRTIGYGRFEVVKFEVVERLPDKPKAKVEWLIPKEAGPVPLTADGPSTKRATTKPNGPERTATT